MTTRVFDFQREPQLFVGAQPNRAAAARSRSKADLRGTILVALLVVPFAGASEAPTGWLVTLLTAVGLLALAATIGARVPWGLLAIVAAGFGFAMPRGQWPAMGPGLFVATALCVVLWIAHRGPSRGLERGRAQMGSRERAAQVMMGLSGERHVGRVLAAELPQDFALINGLALRRGAGDIDHLVVGPTGVFLLETKTMAGQIACDADGSWHRTRVGRAGTPYDAYIGDPAAQVQRNIFAVRQVLRRRVPELLRAPLWIEGMVVFPHPQTQFHALHSRVPAVLLAETGQRISEHSPRRRLQPDEVEAIVAALLQEARADRSPLARQSAQAIVEIALALPLVLALAFGTLAISRIVQTQSAVVAVAHEAARAGALANSPSAAVTRMQERATLVAAGLGLNARAMVLQFDVTRFGGSPGEVEATVRYGVDLGDLPMLGTVAPVVTAEHVEWVDPFRSGIRVGSGASS